MDHMQFMEKTGEILRAAKSGALSEEQRRELAVELAGMMLNESRRILRYSERRQQALLARMMDDPVGKAFATSMTDQCFRSEDNKRIADQLIYLTKKYGIPGFLTPFRRIALSLFRWIGKPLSFMLVPYIKRMLRQEMSAVILPGEPEKLSKHILRRRKEGVRINLNHLGEAILGEEEADRRLQMYLNDLADPSVEYISIKVSTLYSQISLLGWEETLVVLGERLRKLYRAAQSNTFTKPDGTAVPKFVNLDMEEYRDLYLTVELFKRVLDDSEFFRHSAGIVLQSYLPDAFLIQQELTSWAMRRLANGGAPIKIRIVKGANLAMEGVEASLRDWPQAPYLTKSETDSNYKRMVLFGCEPDHAKAVRLGIASHNLFDIAHAMIIREEKHIKEYVTFEMLEGMADHIRRVVQSLTGEILLYCPAATKEEFQSAVAYLMRRLDENTAPENFLRHAFDMLPGTAEWRDQANLFSVSCDDFQNVSYTPRRLQNRFDEPERVHSSAPFSNVADTDWSLPQNIKWAETILRQWSEKPSISIPLVIGGKEISTNVAWEMGSDPSYPDKKRYRYALANEDEAEEAIVSATIAFRNWSKVPLSERLTLLDEAAHQMNRKRGELIGAMVADGGKTVPEADAEVSEAVDFALYYSKTASEIDSILDIEWKPKGPVLVTPPWNFPCSIPAGCILAALATGNSVIFKPAPEAVLVGWELANALWEAGIGKDVLQFINCADDPIGTKIIQDHRIAVVSLTGGTSTAKRFLQMRPGIDLIAETGGKNALIITRMADKDLAVKDLIHSAFGHAGQKCSACSLAIVEKEVYDHPHFRRQLKDAAASLKVGLPWNLSTKINPLIRAPGAALFRGLTVLDEGEEWLLEPRNHPENPNLWSPGIKLGVKPGSFTHQTELFGPVLGVMCAKDLDEAIAFANGTPYGLTSGIHTLDEREQLYWAKRIVAGNCYVNRTITGAIVQRQPFGGCKESSFGRGLKAGGPNYLMQYMQPSAIGLPKERESLDGESRILSQQIFHRDLGDDEDLWVASVGSYAFYWNHYFSKDQDPTQVLGQDNFLRYVPEEHQTLRFRRDDLSIDLYRSMVAVLTCGGRMEVSISPEDAFALNVASLHKTPAISFVVEDESQLIRRIETGLVKRVRFFSQPGELLTHALAAAAVNVIVAPVFANGRVELLHYLREISLSIDYHRYGYLGIHEKATLNQQSIKKCEGSCSCSCG